MLESKKQSKITKENVRKEIKMKPIIYSYLSVKDLDFEEEGYEVCFEFVDEDPILPAFEVTYNVQLANRHYFVPNIEIFTYKVINAGTNRKDGERTYSYKIDGTEAMNLAYEVFKITHPALSKRFDRASNEYHVSLFQYDEKEKENEKTR